MSNNIKELVMIVIVFLYYRTARSSNIRTAFLLRGTLLFFPNSANAATGMSAFSVESEIEIEIKIKDESERDLKRDRKKPLKKIQ